jgi:uncharacterized membrane protein YkoI
MKQVLSLIAVLMLASATNVFAEEDHDKARRALQEGKIIPLTEVLDNVEQQFRGRIIEVELMEDPGQANRFVYEIEMVSETGRLVEVFYDAQTGKPIAIGGQGLSDGDAER